MFEHTQILEYLQTWKGQLLPFLNLYSEIIAFLAAASLLSLFCGWMMHRSRSKRQINDLTIAWEKRYGALEDAAGADIDNLEEQLQSLATETKSLQGENRELNLALKKNDTSIQKARSEAIELNRQHAETQERLQRIIQQKDREIVELGNRINLPSSSDGSRHIAPDASAKINGHAQRLKNAELNHADTVALTRSEVFDATVQMSAVDALPKRGVRELDKQSGKTSDGLDDTLEKTADFTGLLADDNEESTVALDEEALAFARQVNKTRSRE